MSVGAVLAGLAVALVLVAYVARPFRRGGPPDPDRAIEAWVDRVRTRRRHGGEEAGERENPND